MNVDGFGEGGGGGRRGYYQYSNTTIHIIWCYGAKGFCYHLRYSEWPVVWYVTLHVLMALVCFNVGPQCDVILMSILKLTLAVAQRKLRTDSNSIVAYKQNVHLGPGF